jgi:predicted ATPase
MDLGGALTVTKSCVASEAEAAYRRAFVLGQRLGEDQYLFGAIAGLRSIHFTRAELQEARELAEQLVSIAQRMFTPALFIGAHCALGETLFHLGEPTRALQHLEQALTYYDSQQYTPRTVHSRVVSLGGTAWVRQHLGYPDQARQRAQATLSLAQDLSHPFSQIFVFLLSAHIYQALQDHERTRECAESALALCREQDISHWSLYGMILHGWALADQGQLEQIRQGIQACLEVGAKIGLSCSLAMLADAYRRVRQPDEGLKAIAEAFTHLRQTGERYQEAELYRLKGELTLQQSKVQGLRSKVPSIQHSTPSPQAAAEACFLKAVAIAQRQRAKLFELRAVISLSRLWQQQSKKAEARRMLAEIYGWFTEGFDTHDLQEAKALLKELHH